MGEEVNTYFFYRDHIFYMIELMDDADAVANAECNPGTRALRICAAIRCGRSSLKLFIDPTPL